ncbi:MAG: hypothetical protein AAF724_14815 [Pseudomonadota bacterium]
MMASVRAEAAYFATLCVMALAIGLLLPFAQAKADAGVFVVCTERGVAKHTGAPGLLSEDCSCSLICAGCPFAKMAKALAPPPPYAFLERDRPIDHRFAHREPAAPDPGAAAYAIRAPPITV